MRHLVRSTILGLALALLLVPLVGCAGASTQSETPASPSTATSAPSDAVTEDAAPTAFPPAPSDVSGMLGWFGEAYPDAPWLARIKDIKYVKGEVPETGGFANAIVITTDLDFATEQAISQEIATALGEADIQWAKQFVIWFADGDNIQAGGIVDSTP